MWDRDIGSAAGEGEVMVGVGDVGIIVVAEVAEATGKELGVEEVAGEDIDGKGATWATHATLMDKFRNLKCARSCSQPSQACNTDSWTHVSLSVRSMKV